MKGRRSPAETSWRLDEAVSVVRDRWGDRLAFVTVDRTHRLVVGQLVDGTVLHFDDKGDVVDAIVKSAQPVWGTPAGGEAAAYDVEDAPTSRRRPRRMTVQQFRDDVDMAVILADDEGGRAGELRVFRDRLDRATVPRPDGLDLPAIQALADEWSELRPRMVRIGHPRAIVITDAR